MKKKLLIALLGLMLSAGSANALLIDFEDLPGTRLPLPFEDRGTDFESTYLGYNWFSGNGAGLAALPAPDPNTGKQDLPLGWGGATNDSVGLTLGFSDNPQSGVGGDWFAYNAFSPQSLWIDFRGETHTFNSGRFASLLDVPDGLRSNSIEIYGYAGTDLASASLIGAAGSLTFASDGVFETLAGDLAGINFLEIRSNANDTFFTVDDLCFDDDAACTSNSSGTNTSGGSNNNNNAPSSGNNNPPAGGGGTNTVPEPSTVALLGSGLIGMFFWKRNKTTI